MDSKRAEQLLLARGRAQRKHQAKRRAALSLGHAIHVAVNEYNQRLDQTKLEFGSGRA
jgi:hypothetical protein